MPVSPLNDEEPIFKRAKGEAHSDMMPRASWLIPSSTPLVFVSKPTFIHPVFLFPRMHSAHPYASPFGQLRCAALFQGAV